MVIGLAALLGAGAAAAQSLQDRLLAQLQEQGYSSIQVSRTWLGRTRILAESATQRREIIFNPHTGEILRDFWQILVSSNAAGSAEAVAPGGGTTAPGVVDESGQGRGRGRGRGRGGDSGNSGSGDSGSGDSGSGDSGSGNSGSGSGN